VRALLQPWQSLLLVLAGCVNRRQRDVMEYLLAEIGGQSLRAATVTYLEHFHAECNHQGMGDRLPKPGDGVGRSTGEIVCREHFGGLLRYYYREAA